MLELNKLYLGDCMEGMAQFPDKYFELAIVDPPYGIERFKRAHPSRLSKYTSNSGFTTANDASPNNEYFEELFRVSQNQVIWGYNHLSDMLPKCKEFVFWYKHQPVVSYADGELAWTSFQKSAKCFDYPFFGGTGADGDMKRIHPMQKPIDLYKWILHNYAKEGDKILDTHVGSASSLIACHEYGYDFVGFEIDEDYYKAATERLEAHRAQQRFA